MVFNKLMCQTLYVVQYTKHMGNKPGVFQQTVMCAQFPLLSLQSNVTHTFHPFMATTQQRSSQDMVQLLAIWFLNYVLLPWQSVTNRPRQAIFVAQTC